MVGTSTSFSEVNGVTGVPTIPRSVVGDMITSPFVRGALESPIERELLQSPRAGVSAARQLKGRRRRTSRGPAQPSPRPARMQDRRVLGSQPVGSGTPPFPSPTERCIARDPTPMTDRRAQPSVGPCPSSRTPCRSRGPMPSTCPAAQCRWTGCRRPSSPTRSTGRAARGRRGFRTWSPSGG